MGITQTTNVAIVRQPLVGLQVEFNGQLRNIEARLAGDTVTLQFGNFPVTIKVIAVNGQEKFK